jgi:hypothetical protein
MYRVVRVPEEPHKSHALPDAGGELVCISEAKVSADLQAGILKKTHYLFPPEGGMIVEVRHSYSQNGVYIGNTTKEELHHLSEYLVTSEPSVEQGSKIDKYREYYKGHVHKSIEEVYSGSENLEVKMARASIRVPNPPPASLQASGKKIRKLKGPVSDEGVIFDPGVFISPKDKQKSETFSTGTRVELDLSSTVRRQGTIVSKSMNGSYLICLDEPHPAYTNSPHVVGKARGINIGPQHIRKMDQNDRRNWAGVPDDIGVILNVESEKDAHGFAPFLYPGCTGRIIHRDGAFARCAWFVDEDGPYKRMPYVTESKSYNYTCVVPFSALRFCLLGPDRSSLSVWPREGGEPNAKTLSVKEGDTVVYSSSRPIRLNEVTVCRGTILRVRVSDGRSARLTVLGGCPAEAEGAEIGVPIENLEPFEHKWINRGINVEVTLDVLFKKSSLQGKRGVVLTPTDSDGDIGIQFAEDLGAGSLDGVGKNGHCLYISSEAVKVSE